MLRTYDSMKANRTPTVCPIILGQVRCEIE